MFSFNSKLIKTDVTAIKISPDHVFAGIGGYLHVFCRMKNKLVNKVRIFDGQKIHGIIPKSLYNTNILIYGGPYISSAIFNWERESFTQIVPPVVVKDWILHAKWLDDGDVAAILMHNNVLLFDNNFNIKKEITCSDKCLLYSAHICNSSWNSLVILSGTVFSEILIWWPSKFELQKNSPVLKRLEGHKGVIFCIDYNENNGLICSSSDDRTTIIWSINHMELIAELEEFNIEINYKFNVYGHISRIFRCKLLNEYFLTAGEDSFLNIWDLKGKLIRKIDTHQGGSVWALDCLDEVIATGGGDSGVVLFPLRLNLEKNVLNVPNHLIPKRIAICNSENLVVITDNGVLYYYIVHEQRWIFIRKHFDLKNYVILEVFNFKLSLSGYEGQFYIYQEADNNLILNISYQVEDLSRIFSFHWLSNDLFLICLRYGRLCLFFLHQSKVHKVIEFILPSSHDRYSTAACLGKRGTVIVGDRRGNIHLYQIGHGVPIQTIKKVFTHLGVTKLFKINDNIVSLGRNAIIRSFAFTGKLELISSDKVPFTWLATMENNLLLAFSASNFIIWDYPARRILLEIECGGGHRSWSFKQIEDKLLFTYIKNKSINSINCSLKELRPIDIINGYHFREINSLKAIKQNCNYLIVSGGEDTILRLSQIHFDGNFNIINNLKSHLSSIRTICYYRIDDDANALLFSGGGRGQIVCWKLTTDNCYEQCAFYECLNENEGETRIMDLIAGKIDGRILLFAASSEGTLKIFYVELNDGRYALKLRKVVFYELKCIIKICLFHFVGVDVLVSMATDGNLVFWNVNDLLNSCKIPLRIVNCHQSGINSYAFYLLHNNLLLFLTGGDDNAIVLNLFKFICKDQIEIVQISRFTDCGSHCAQITGAFICDKYFLTTSIDQKLNVFHYTINNNNNLTFKILCQYESTIADIQGMECFENENNFDVFLYGNGIEYVKVIKK